MTKTKHPADKAERMKLNDKKKRPVVKRRGPKTHLLQELEDQETQDELKKYRDGDLLG